MYVHLFQVPGKWMGLDLHSQITWESCAYWTTYFSLNLRTGSNIVVLGTVGGWL